MVLKINNNLITPSHIIEGEKVNDTYFEGKYHLMLPNSEEHYLTSVSERKQLLNESLRSNLYDRKTRGTIVSNTTTGKMFDEEIVSENIVTVSNFATNNYLVIPNATIGTATTWEQQWAVKTGSNVNTSLYICSGNNASYADFGIQNSYWNMFLSSNGSSWNITGSDGTGRKIQVKTNTQYLVNISFDGSKYEMKVSEDNGTNWTTTGTYNSTTKVYAINSFRVGNTYDKMWPWKDNIVISESYIKINGQLFFNGKTAVKGVDYTINGSPTIKEETITTRTVTQHPFNQSVTINSSEIQEGTKYLVDYPGMFQIKTEYNTLAVKFLFDDEPVWKYIKQEELIEGDNVFSLVSDTEKLKFVVNTTEHILVDSTLTEEQKYLVNGNRDNCYKLNVFNHNNLPWVIETFAKYGNSIQSYSTIIDCFDGYKNVLIGYIDQSSRRNIGFYLSSDGNNWDIYGSSELGKYIELNKNYYFKCVFDGASYKYYYKEENEKDYILAASVNSSRKINIANLYLRGFNNIKINITKTKIWLNDEIWFDGKTAVQGVDYTVIGSPTIETETIHVGGEIPELTAGYLGYREGWKLKQGE